MKDKVVNYSLLKKTIIVFAFLINVACLLLISFLWKPWIYLAIIGISFCAFTLLVGFNKFIYSKLVTIIAYSVLPLFGLAMYFLGKFNNRYLRERKIYQDLEFRAEDDEDNDVALNNFYKNHPEQYKLVNYFSNYLNFPLFQNSVTKFLDGGSKFFDELFAELQHAKHYILLQEFMIKEGDTWDRIFEILKLKARRGVEIKLLYDPLDCKKAFTDKLTFKKLENYKIECIPFRSGLLGYENHRKMVVIDGVVAFTGGVNISDVYSDLEDMDANWEISGIKITGDAVWRMAVSFFNDWQFSKGKLTGDFINYMPERMPKLKTSEFVQPIALNPLTNKDENKKFFLNMINNARTSIDIISSYINVDSDIIRAIKMATYSGVKVNIVVSSISDRSCNFAISRDQYKELMRANVSIMEYTPGYVRSKIILIDHALAFVGTVALDLRWLNQKYENGVIVNGKDTVREISKYTETLKYKSRLVAFKDLKDRPLSQKLVGWINRVFRFRY